MRQPALWGRVSDFFNYDILFSCTRLFCFVCFFLTHGQKQKWRWCRPSKKPLGQKRVGTCTLGSGPYLIHRSKSSKATADTSDRSRALSPRLPPLFWVKKEKITEGRKAGRASKTKPWPQAPLAKGLDPPLHTGFWRGVRYTYRTKTVPFKGVLGTSNPRKNFKLEDRTARPTEPDNFRRDQFGIDLGIISGSIWGSFQGWGHFGVDLGIISRLGPFGGRFRDHFGVDLGIISGLRIISWAERSWTYFTLKQA